MGAPGARPVVADTGALIAFDRGVQRVVFALSEAAAVHVPAGVLAQAWRDPKRQARLARLSAAQQTSIEPLDGPAAKAVGLLCAASSTNDVTDAHVVQVARQFDGVVFTSDPEDLRRIDPRIELVAC